jgi:hypothetical protein
MRIIIIINRGDWACQEKREVIIGQKETTPLTPLELYERLKPSFLRAGNMDWQDPITWWQNDRTSEKKKKKEAKRLFWQEIQNIHAQSTLESDWDIQTADPSLLSKHLVSGTIPWAWAVMSGGNRISPEELKQNYLQLAKKWHPDKPSGCALRMNLINEAYQLLKNLIKPGSV